MPDWLTYIFATVLGIAAVLGALAGLVFLLALLTRGLARRMDHPVLGPIEKAWGDGWRGTRPCGSAFAGDATVMFNLPGGREGPQPDAVALLDGIEARWESVDTTLTNCLGREIDALGADAVGAEVAQAAATGNEAALRDCSRIVEIDVEIDERTRALIAEIRLLHAWDEEHIYVLRLDAALRPAAYGLGVGDLLALSETPV